MPRRKKKSNTDKSERTKAPAEVHFKEAVFPGDNVFRNVTISGAQVGIQWGEGSAPPEEELPAAIVVHGPQGPMLIDMESTSTTMITGGGSIEKLDGRLVHRPGGGKIYGYQRAGESVFCECGREFYSFSTECSTCGRPLEK